MSKTSITVDIFDLASIDEAIDALNAYATEYEKKTEEYKKRLAEECASYASANFDNSWYDDYVDIGEDTYAFSAKTPYVICYAETDGDEVIVHAEGEEAVWVEFGAGIHYNLSLGGNPNPFWDNTDLKGIGEYGYGNGKYHAWKAPNGVTRGTKAQMPLYNACIQTEQVAKEIATEVFK